jgi:hypothetical protein
MLATTLLDSLQDLRFQSGICKMVRLRITQRLHGSIDGMQLERFQPGLIYDVGMVLAEVLLAEQWAVPVDDEDGSTVTPVTSVRQFAEHGSNYTWRRRSRRDQAIAADRPPRRRRSHHHQKTRKGR